jgi:hypothetical protein
VWGFLGEFFMVTWYVYLHVQVFNIVYRCSSCSVAVLSVLLRTGGVCVCILHQIKWYGIGG